MPKTVLLLLVLVLGLAWGADARAEVKRQVVSYDLPGGAAAEGVLLTPSDPKQSGAGVLVVPEWWGRTAYPESRGQALAERGYHVFIADMYGGGKTTRDPKQAQQWSSVAKAQGLAELATAALDTFKKQGGVDSDRIGVIGFCFGGSTVADLLRDGAPIAAGVSFHGGLGGDLTPSADAAPDGGYPPLMLAHGGADPMVKPADFAAYVEGTIAAGVPLTVLNFPGAVHAFTNPEADQAGIDGVSYDADAAEASVRMMHAFLDAALTP